MIIDCFTFYNELKMLKFRFAEMNDVVDWFVLVEATRTFTGKEKKLFFKENQHLYEEYKHKIIHIVVDDMPIEGDAWARETFQRNAIDRGVSTLQLTESDIILISDVDEIINTILLKNLRFIPSFRGSILFHLDFYYYNLTTRNKQAFSRTMLATYDVYNNMGRSPQSIRFSQPFNYIDNKAGWHFSYFFDEYMISNKIQNFSHTELNLEKFTNLENIRERVRMGVDLFDGEGAKWEQIPIEQNSFLPNNYKLLFDDSDNKYVLSTDVRQRRREAASELKNISAAATSLAEAASAAAAALEASELLLEHMFH